MYNSDSLIQRYLPYLPVTPGQTIVSLGEGNTPLIRLGNLPRELNCDIELYVKFEGMNPTGSFKDRGMTVAMTKAVEAGSRAVLCASTGNTSASAAAYAARAGLAAFVIIPAGQIAMGKLAQAVMHGATVLQIEGNFDDGMEIVKSIADSHDISIVNSINPYRLEGQKTAAFEVIDALGKVPDFHCLPVGNAGNITAYWMGYQEYYQAEKIEQMPHMVGYQASGAAPFVEGNFVETPETVATAIRIGQPQSWEKAIAAQEDSGGWFSALDDSAILAAQRLLAATEGIFCEPASAAAIAGACCDISNGDIPEGSVVVCTLTGHGLKDPEIAIAHCEDAVIEVEANADAILDVIETRLAES